MFRICPWILADLIDLDLEYDVACLRISMETCTTEILD